VLSNANARLRVAKVKLLEDLVLGNHILALSAIDAIISILLVITVEALLLDLALSKLVRNLETTREARTFLKKMYK
jgi:hypothetical protein